MMGLLCPEALCGFCLWLLCFPPVPISGRSEGQTFPYLKLCPFPVKMFSFRGTAGRALSSADVAPSWAPVSFSFFEPQNGTGPHRPALQVCLYIRGWRVRACTSSEDSGCAEGTGGRSPGRALSGPSALSHPALPSLYASLSRHWLPGFQSAPKLTAALPRIKISNPLVELTEGIGKAIWLHLHNYVWMALNDHARGGGVSKKMYLLTRDS